MKDSSLKIARELFTEIIDETTKIDNIDKAELLINVFKYLDPKEYRENIKILSKRREKWKKIIKNNKSLWYYTTT